MRNPISVWILLALWATAVAVSVWYLVWSTPTGDGLTRGLNRLAGFLGWQMGAAVIAAVAWWAGSAVPRGSPLRLLARLPGMLAAALAVAILALMLWANLTKPAPQPPRPATPTTAPVADAPPVDGG